MPNTFAARPATYRVALVVFTLFVFLTSVVSPRAALATEPETTPTPEASASASPEGSSVPATVEPEVSAPAEPSTSEAPASETPSAPAGSDPPSDVPSAPPTIASDQPDYAPGDLVTLTGTNWQPGESVHIFVNDDLGFSWSRSADVVADADGVIIDQFQLPTWFVAVYRVVATGELSGMATATFTDGNLRVTTSEPEFTITYERFTTNASCAGTPTETVSGTAKTQAGQTFATVNNEGMSVRATVPQFAGSPSQAFSS